MKSSAWLLLAFGFVVICMLGDLFFTRIIVYGTPTCDAGRIYHLYQQNEGEMPIFGASQAQADYNPAEIGLNTFNYGISAASLDVTETMLGIELAKHKTTPIIVDILPLGIHRIGDESTYIPYAFDSRFRRLLKENNAMKWRYYLPGIRYFGYYDFYFKDFLVERMQLTKKIIRGYTYQFTEPRVDPSKFNEMVRVRSEMSVGYHPDKDQDSRLLADITRHPERLFILVYSPLHSSCYVRFENADEFQSFKEKLTAFPNVVLIDFGRANYPDAFYLDTTHLNQRGAIDFSRKLGNRIREVLRERNFSND